jgi:hypothetical protein
LADALDIHAVRFAFVNAVDDRTSGKRLVARETDRSRIHGIS